MHALINSVPCQTLGRCLLSREGLAAHTVMDKTGHRAQLLSRAAVNDTRGRLGLDRRTAAHEQAPCSVRTRQAPQEAKTKRAYGVYRGRFPPSSPQRNRWKKWCAAGYLLICFCKGASRADTSERLVRIWRTAASFAVMRAVLVRTAHEH